MVKFDDNKPVVIQLGGTEAKQGSYQLFREAQFTARDIAISYRELNHWSEIGLIDDERGDNEKGWRKFSLAGLVWVQLIKELRAIGVSISTIQQAKKSLFTTQVDESALDMLRAIALCVSTQKPVLIVVTEQFAKIMLLTEFEQSLRQERQKPFVTIRLDQLLSELMPELDWTIRDSSKTFEKLSKSEARAMEVIRDGSFERITVIKKDGKIDRLEKTSQLQKLAKTLEQIKDLGHGKASLSIQDGEFVFSEITDMEKIHE